MLTGSLFIVMDNLRDAYKMMEILQEKTLDESLVFPAPIPRMPCFWHIWDGCQPSITLGLSQACVDRLCSHHQEASKWPSLISYAFHPQSNHPQVFPLRLMPKIAGLQPTSPEVDHSLKPLQKWKPLCDGGLVKILILMIIHGGQEPKKQSKSMKPSTGDSTARNQHLNPHSPRSWQ